MSKTIRKGLIALLCVAVGGCSSIGKINGVDLDTSRMGALSDGPQPYCTQNVTQQWVCILGAATIVGAMAAIIATADHSKPQQAPQAPEPPAPPPPPPPPPPR